MSKRLLSAIRETLDIEFIFSNGTRKLVKGSVGDTLLQVARKNDVPLEGTKKLKLIGACEGATGCGTCHVKINDSKQLDTLEEKTEMEEDILDCVPDVSLSYVLN